MKKKGTYLYEANKRIRELQKQNNTLIGIVNNLQRALDIHDEELNKARKPQPIVLHAHFGGRGQGGIFTGATADRRKSTIKQKVILNVYDYDIEGEDEENLSKDPQGNDCIHHIETFRR